MIENAFLAGFKKEAQVPDVEERDLIEAAGEAGLEEGMTAIGGYELARRLGNNKVAPYVPKYMKGAPARIGGLFAGALASNIAAKKIVDQIKGR